MLFALNRGLVDWDVLTFGEGGQLSRGSPAEFFYLQVLINRRAAATANK